MFQARYTRKQAGVIYRNVKEGKLEMTKEAISDMYYWADMECYADTADRFNLDLIKLAVDDIFAGRLEDAQACINEFSGIR